MTTNANISELPPHPLAELFPCLEGDELEVLKQSISENGQREPIWTYQGQLVDGRNRYRACQDLKIEPKIQEWEGRGSLVSFVLDQNLHRRHLTESQRAMVAAKIKDHFAEEAKERMLAGRNPPPKSEEGDCGEAAGKAAKVLKVGKDSVYQAQKVLKKGAPELRKCVEAGAVKVSAAAQLSQLPQPEQAAVVAQGAKAVKAKARELRTHKGRTAKKSQQVLGRTPASLESETKQSLPTQAGTPCENETTLTLTLPLDPSGAAPMLVKQMVAKVGIGTTREILDRSFACLEELIKNAATG